jgi:hypothetical protein
VYALAGDREAALAALDSAIQNGFTREAAVAEEEFETLRDTPEFKSLVGMRGR